jgi:hypothetical protein
MNPEPFTKAQRVRLLSEYQTAMRAYNAIMDEIDEQNAEAQSAKAKPFMAVAESREREYFSRLHYIPMSCCPYDNQPLIRSFDPFGFDGLWWNSSATPEELPACKHFCVLLGAVNFQGQEPVGGDFKARPGPEVPYVIPALLEMPGMLAVISQVQMDKGYIAYPIAYFAETPPPPEQLVPGWGRTMHVYTTPEGESGWKGANDPWDFDLKPWLQMGKIRWCPPEDPSTLSSDPPEQCPYVDLQGLQERVVIEDRKFWTEGVPMGGLTFPVD